MFENRTVKIKKKKIKKQKNTTAKKKSLRSRFQSREAQLSQAMKITQTAQSPKGSLFTT